MIDITLSSLLAMMITFLKLLAVVDCIVGKLVEIVKLSFANTLGFLKVATASHYIEVIKVLLGHGEKLRHVAGDWKYDLMMNACTTGSPTIVDLYLSYRFPFDEMIFGYAMSFPTVAALLVKSSQNPQNLRLISLVSLIFRPRLALVRALFTRDSDLHFGISTAISLVHAIANNIVPNERALGVFNKILKYLESLR